MVNKTSCDNCVCVFVNTKDNYLKCLYLLYLYMFNYIIKTLSSLLLNKPKEKEQKTKHEIKNFDYDKCVQFLPLQDGEVAFCTSVYDGDTIRLCWTTKGIDVKSLCRIDGIDTPELRGSSQSEKELALKAKERLDRVVTGKFVTIKNPGTEKFGRILADIQTNDIESIREYMLADPTLAKPYDGGKKAKWE